MTLSAAFAYINHRFLKMPFVIGLFFLSTVFSLVIISSKSWDRQHYAAIKSIIDQINISKFVLDVMLGLLLFAGSLQTRWTDIRSQLRPITLFSVGGVILSTILIAYLLSFVCNLFHFPVAFIHCLIFGALISPTDPIAVLGI